MFDSVLDVDPAAYADFPLERVMTRVTSWGRRELEFCCTQRELFVTYRPNLSDKVPRFGVGGGPYDRVFCAACWVFLRDRSREFQTDEELAAWAVKHHWPNPERFVPSAVEEPAGRGLEDQAAIRAAIDERGKYDPRLAFLLNLAIAVWEPSQRRFGFPDIPDHRIANACREYLRGAAVALYDPLGQKPDPFAPLIEHAASHNWPELDALRARTEMWRGFQPK